MHGHAPLPVPKGVRLAKINEVDWLWERLKKQHSIFFEPTEDDGLRFAELFAHPTSHSFVVDEGGLLFLSDLEPGNMGFFNGVVWDDKLYGQTKRAKEILAFLFTLFNLRRVSAVIPADNKLARKYIEKMGFKREAQFRKAIRRPNGPIDMFVYGLLREEVIANGRSSSGRNFIHLGANARLWPWLSRFWHDKWKGSQKESDSEHAHGNAEAGVVRPSGNDPGSVASRNGWFKGLFGFAWPGRHQPR